MHSTALLPPDCRGWRRSFFTTQGTRLTISEIKKRTVILRAKSNRHTRGHPSRRTWRASLSKTARGRGRRTGGRIRHSDRCIGASPWNGGLKVHLPPALTVHITAVCPGSGKTADRKMSLAKMARGRKTRRERKKAKLHSEQYRSHALVYLAYLLAGIC